MVLLVPSLYSGAEPVMMRVSASAGRVSASTSEDVILLSNAPVDCCLGVLHCSAVHEFSLLLRFVDPEGLNKSSGHRIF
jgi:hypothetical protein